MTEEKVILEGQIRECYGRVVYAHKTHEKCAELLLKRHRRIKIAQIVLSALITGGVVSALLPHATDVVTFITAVLSTVLLVLNAYTKDYDLGEIAEKHRESASKIWLIREKYLSLLTDLRSEGAAPAEYRSRRDGLLQELSAIYRGAPSTSVAAYRLAQKALQKLDEMTFTDAEIDKFLPSQLRRTG